MSGIQIRLPTSSEQIDHHFTQHVTKLVNEAYAETESSLYKPGQMRTNGVEVCNWLASRHFYLAFMPGAVYPIGTVLVHKVDSSVSDIGVLTVHRDARSSGLGRRLIAHAEAIAVAEGSKRTRLEMLVPKAPQAHEIKGYLRRWYKSLGYEAVRTAGIADVVPQLVDSFEDGSEFLVMEKVLQR